MFNVRRVKISKIINKESKKGYPIKHIVITKTKKGRKNKRESYKMLFSSFGEYNIEKISEFKVGDVVNIKFGIDSMIFADENHKTTLKIEAIEKWKKIAEIIQESVDKKAKETHKKNEIFAKSLWSENEFNTGNKIQ